MIVNDSLHMKLLVTGADGFVGRYLIEETLRHYGARAQVFATSLGSGKELLRDDRIAFHKLNIVDGRAVESAIVEFQPTHIVHLAAISHVPTATKDPKKVWQVNVMGTLVLLEALRKFAPDVTLLNISSSEIYGESFLSGNPVDETALLQPRNAYAKSKAAADVMVRQFTGDIKKNICARPFNHIGPRQSADFVVSAFASQIATIEKGNHLPELRVGNLEALRDFCDVRDVVRAYLALLDHSEKIDNGAAINICSGKPRSVRSILNDLTALSSVSFSVKQDENRIRPSDIPFAIGCGQKIKALTGWSPQISWEVTLRDILNYWRTQSE